MVNMKNNIELIPMKFDLKVNETHLIPPEPDFDKSY